MESFQLWKLISEKWLMQQTEPRCLCGFVCTNICLVMHSFNQCLRCLIRWICLHADVFLLLLTGRLVRLARGSDDQLLFPFTQIPCCVCQHHHLGLGHLPLLPKTQSKSALQEVKGPFFLMFLLICPWKMYFYWLFVRILMCAGWQSALGAAVG